MGKIIKFGQKKENENLNPDKKRKSNKEEGQNVKNFETVDFESKLRHAIEDYIKSVFAVKEVLGMDLVYKENKNTIGVIGVISYEHKRRPGTFVADFISNCTKIGNDIKVGEVAFQAGEPDLYMQIFNILKAKKALPEIID